MKPGELLSLAAALMAGAALGAFFFTGLWWTVQKGIHAKKGALLFVGSFIARALLALGAFYFIGRGHPDRLALCLVGFVVGRFLIARLHLQKASAPKEHP
jgi:F1F0 ATPase subunit 2